MEIIDRSSAKSLGLKRYFTGLLCKSGHESERMVSSRGCMECLRLINKKSHIKNRDENLAKMASYRAENRESLSNAQKIRYSENRSAEIEKARKYRASNLTQINARMALAYYAKQSVFIERSREYRAKNKDAISARRKMAYATDPMKKSVSDKAYVERNKVAVQSRRKNYQQQNSAKISAYQIIYKSKNPQVNRLAQQRRRISVIQATPNWYSEFDEFVMQEASLLAVARECVTGFKWHVDHMIPLRGVMASGLHVGLNIAVIPASLNISKKHYVAHFKTSEWIGNIGCSA